MTEDEALIRLRWMAANRRSDTLHHELDAEALDAAVATLTSQQALREALELLRYIHNSGLRPDYHKDYKRLIELTDAALARASSQDGPGAATPAYTDRDMAQMFSDGVDVARSYGDNAFHLWGPQLERQFRRALERLKKGEGQNVQPLKPGAATPAASVGQKDLQRLVDDMWLLCTLPTDDVIERFGDSRIKNDHCRLNYMAELLAGYVTAERTD